MDDLEQVISQLGGRGKGIVKGLRKSPTWHPNSNHVFIPQADIVSQYISQTVERLRQHGPVKILMKDGKKVEG